MGFLDNLFETKIEREESGQLYPYEHAYWPMRGGLETIGDWMGRPQEFYPGPTFAPLTGEQRQGMAALMDASRGMGAMLPGMAGGYESALGRPEDVLGMGLQDVASNPYLAGIADVMERRSEERMLEDVLPQMEAGAVGMGGLGGSRLAVGAQQAERDRQRALDEALAGLYGDAWSQGLGAETSRYNQAVAGQTSALGMTPQLMGAYAAPAAPLLQAGGMRQANQQAYINEAMARHQFEQMEPFERASMGLGQVSPIAAQFGRSEGQSQQVGQPSTFSNLGNLIGLGAALIGGYGGMSPMYGGYGAAGGFGMGPMGYGMGYGINPFGHQAQMLSQQWGPMTSMWG